MNDPEIRFVDWGVANNFNDYIEIHKELPNYPDLYEPILNHEKKHSRKPFSLYDLVHDFKRTKGVNRFKLWKFMIKRPKTWVQILPFYYRKDKGFVYDINLALLELTSIMLFLILIKIISWIFL